ncbi:hypothetical protein IV102_02500 [bacterium]|nr:hypothetical protein [bacterium]
MSEPYKPPSKKEVEQSGTADWVQQALDKHEVRQQKLSQVFGDSQRELRQEKDKLADVWRTPAEAEEVDKGPDLFAAERSKGAQEKQKLASVWDQDRAQLQAEEDQLRNMFGGGGSSTNKNPKKRR